MSPETLDAMLAAGCTAEQIVATVKAWLLAKRSSAAARTARWREKVCDVGDVTERSVSSQNNGPLSILTSSKEEKKENKRERRATQIPANYRPAEPAWQKAVAEIGQENAERELAKFINHAMANGRTAKLWDAAFSNWIMQAVDYQRARKPAPAATAAALSDKISWEQAFAIYEKTKRWSAAAPVKDIIQAPPEILKQFGYSPDGRKLEHH